MGGTAGVAYAASTPASPEPESVGDIFPDIRPEIRAMLERHHTVTTTSSAVPFSEFHTISIAANTPLEDTHAESVGREGAFFGVYDGHSGTAASAFARDELIAFTRCHVRDALVALKDGASEKEVHEAVIGAMQEAFMACDQVFLGESLATNNLKDGLAGAPLILAFIAGTNLYIASAGDCRAVLGKRTDNGSVRPVVLTDDHSGSSATEAKRIIAAHPGEWDAIYAGRVKGRLQPTRGLGDGKYKKAEFNQAVRRPIPPPYNPPYTTALPDVSHLNIATDDSFLLLATDGLWDAFSNHVAVELVAKARNLQPDYALPLVLHTLLIDAARVFQKAVGMELANPMATLLQSNKRRHFYDDTTVTAVFFTPTRVQSAAKSEKEAGSLKTCLLRGAASKDVNADKAAKERVTNLINNYRQQGKY